jgi:hypothetical protein
MSLPDYQFELLASARKELEAAHNGIPVTFHNIRPLREFGH